MTWGIPVLMGLAALGLALPMLRQWLKRRAMERTIAAGAVETMHNVLLDNGMDGETFFEWLLLTPDTIRVLMTNSRNDVIFAGERMDTWAQMGEGRTTHFDNPLYSLDASRVTLRHHLPNMAIEEILLFTGDCSFPKGRPDTVWMLKELESRPADESPQSVPPALHDAWEKLQRLARKVDPAREGYLLPVRQAFTSRWLMIALLLAGAVAWPFWRYFHGA